MNIFEVASRKKYRFPSVQGSLNVEQLWSLPLISKREGHASLNDIAIEINKQLKAEGEESFVETTKSDLQVELAIKLDIVKHIIKTKQDEERAAKTRAANAAERETLQNLLKEKKLDSLKNLSEEEIQARMAALE